MVKKKRKITTGEIRDITNKLDKIIEYYKEKYREDKSEKDWRTYEQRRTLRMKRAGKELKALLDKAAEGIEIIKDNNRGRKPKLTAKDKALIILIKEIFDLSNRELADMIFIFSLMAGVDVSYKTIERAYDDELVKLILHNLFMLMVKEKLIDDVDLAGDGTGYSLSIKKHYADVKDEGKQRKDFVYYFALLDLRTNLYVGYGYSKRSERDAFDKAMKIMSKLGINVKSVRLDRYYSSNAVVKEYFDGKDVKLYLIPKKNASVKGCAKWKEVMQSFADDVYGFLREYFKRNRVESMFSFDKRRFSSRLRVRKDERIATSLLARTVLHNLFWFYG